MSMVGYFFLVSEETVERVLAEPSGVHALIDAAYEEDASDARADVDKAWHCLHFLLTGTAWEGEPPLDFIVRGGTEVGDEDVGYGPARAFRAREVAAIARALEPIGPDALRARFDAKRMEELEIYPGGSPGGWSEVDPRTDETFGYFTGAYEDVKALVTRGAAAGQGMLVWLS
jgi:hypothetical protein